MSKTSKKQKPFEPIPVKNNVVGKRLDEAFAKMFEGDWENALIQICIAMDATAKAKYDRAQVGDRIRSLVTDNEEFIIDIAFEGRFSAAPGQVTYHEFGNLSQVLYDTVRCGILHGDDISEHVVHQKQPYIGMEEGKFVVTNHLLTGLIFSLIGEPVNARQTLEKYSEIGYGGKGIELNTFWGKGESLRRTIHYARTINPDGTPKRRS